MGTAGRQKNQFMALVDNRELDRMDALRIVMQQSRAEINRIVLKGTSLSSLERQYAGKLELLKVLATGQGMDLHEFVHRLVHKRQKVPSLAEMETYTHEQLKAALNH